MKNTDVLIRNGKIAQIGQNLNVSGATVIDATGKHLTNGIIDEHSHIATAAVNESGHNSSAEVTIEDVVNPDDINIYRNLSGGVTTIQILHGSANQLEVVPQLSNLNGVKMRMVLSLAILRNSSSSH